MVFENNYNIPTHSLQWSGQLSRDHAAKVVLQALAPYWRQSNLSTQSGRDGSRNGKGQLLSNCNEQYLDCQSWPFYNSTWSILIQLIRVMIVRWQYHRVNAKEIVLPVCDKSYHTNKRKVQKGEEIEVLRNCAMSTVIVGNEYKNTFTMDLIMNPRRVMQCVWYNTLTEIA